MLKEDMKAVRGVLDKKRVTQLFLLCFLVYFCTYLGRLNYAASLAEMIRTEGFSKAQAGIIGTFFFFSYGIGQLISGFLGDRLPGKWMIFCGMTVSGMANGVMGLLNKPEMMSIVWCVNGLAQAFIWSPIVKIFYEYLEIEVRRRLCIYINFSVPLGTVGAYLLTASLIAVKDWRWAFYVPAVLLLLVAGLWCLGMGRMEAEAKRNGSRNCAEAAGQIDSAEEAECGLAGPERKASSWKVLMIASGLCFLMLTLCVQGALKDGVTTWIPTYLGEKHNLGAMAAILSTMVIPLCNLSGVTLAALADRAIGRNEVKTSALFFGTCGISLLVLLIRGGGNVVLALAMLAVSTTSMMAVNTMLIGVLPSYFGKLGRASSVSGILNSCVYIGSAVSTYGIGALSAAWGWNPTIFIWVIGAAVSAVICLAISRRWKTYMKKELQ